MMCARIVPFLLLVCAALLGGCLPGMYVSSIPADGVVVDAVTDAPLPGASICYNGDRCLTDKRGAFSFPRRTSLTTYHLAGEDPMWNRLYALVVEKEGYVPRRVILGGMGSTAAEHLRVRMEPSSVPEGIKALDAAVGAVKVHHGTDGRVLVLIDIRFPHPPESLADLARVTRTVAGKVVRSGLAGGSPDVGFYLSGPANAWYMTIRWSGNGEGVLDGLDADRRAWLHSPAFPRWLAGVDARITAGRVIFHERDTPEPQLSFRVALAEDPQEYDMERTVWDISDRLLQALLSRMKPERSFDRDPYPGIRHPSKVHQFHARLGWTGEYLGGLDWSGATDAQWLNDAAFAFLSGEPEAMFAGFAEGSSLRRAYAPFIKEAATSMGRMPEVFRRGEEGF